MELIPQPHGGKLRRGNPPPPGGWPGAGRPPCRVWRDSVRAAYAAAKAGLIPVEAFEEILGDALWRSKCRGDERGSVLLALWILDNAGVQAG